ncbi:MAG TPA: MFS transporter [Actinomycetota bacterium]|jgi:MFS family permease
MAQPRSDRRARHRPGPQTAPSGGRRPPEPGSFASAEAARVEEQRLAEDSASRSRIARARRAVRGLAVDTRPLREHRDFRLLWFGQLISETGHQMTRVAIWIQVFAITGSAAAVGLTGLVELVFLLAASVAGGSIVDRFDRRRLLLLTQVAFAGASTLLLVNALQASPPVWIIYLGAGLTAAISGIASPTGLAMTPNLVARGQLAQALALNQVMLSATMIAGPAIGGIVVGQAGFQWAYAIDVLTYGATITAALLMRPMPPAEESRTVTGTKAIKEGFAYLKGKPVLQSTFYADLIAMIFGMPRALFPVLAVQEFHGGAEIVGVMASSLAIGAVLGAVTTGWVGRVRRQGLATLIAVGIWGACIVGFGLANGSLWLALFFLAIAGGADVISAVFRGSILQLSVPEKLRGRLSAIHILVVTGGPRLGDFESGVVAALFTPVASVLIGGLACVAGVVGLGIAVPQFRRWRVGDET